MNNNCPPLTEFDQLTLGNSTQMLKAILPFLDFKTQQMLSMVIRIQELIITVKFYRLHTSTALNRGWASGYNQTDLFMAIQKYCPDTNLNIFSNFSNIFQAMQMENFMSNMASAAASTDGKDFDMAINMMDSSQQKSYEEFLKELENMDFENIEKESEN